MLLMEKGWGERRGKNSIELWRLRGRRSNMFRRVEIFMGFCGLGGKMSLCV